MTDKEERLREARISQRTRGIMPSASVSIADKIRKMKSEGLDIIELQTGDPDFATPEHIVRAAYEAMRQGYTHYVSSRGIPELREAIAEKLKDENNIETDPETDIIVTPGTIHSVFAAVMATVDSGDEVIIPDPCWVAYPGCVALAGGKVVRAPCKVNSLEIDIDRLTEVITPKTRMLILNYPSNPTGMTLSDKELERIVGIAIKYNLLILADEIYEKVIYNGGKHLSIAGLEGMTERTITVNGFSKTYAMTGWRIGYACADAKIITEMLKAQQYSVTCANSFVQKAAVAALTGSQECIKHMVEEYDKRRQVIVEGLNGIKGISCRQPQGTFYAFADISGLGLSSVESSALILDKAGVGSVPGSAYGPSGEGYVRFSFANSIENIEKAISRIKEAL